MTQAEAKQNSSSTLDEIWETQEINSEYCETCFVRLLSVHRTPLHVKPNQSLRSLSERTPSLQVRCDRSLYQRNAY